MELNISENAKTILAKRYLDKNETPYQRYNDMSEKIASIEDNPDYWHQEFFRLFEEQKALPNSPTIMNFGKNGRQQQGSACFVLPINDDLNDIFDTIRKASLIHKSGGGCFRKGTKVLLEDKTSKNIEDIKVDEKVLTYNIEKNKFESGTVMKTFLMDVEQKEKLQIEFEDGSIIECTDDHPFGVMENGKFKWVKAKDLTENMEIINCYHEK